MTAANPGKGSSCWMNRCSPRRDGCGPHGKDGSCRRMNCQEAPHSGAAASAEGVFGPAAGRGGRTAEPSARRANRTACTVKQKRGAFSHGTSKKMETSLRPPRWRDFSGGWNGHDAPSSLNVEEYEAIRLIDLEDMTQGRMRRSDGGLPAYGAAALQQRPQKVAQFLVGGGGWRSPGRLPHLRKRRSPRRSFPLPSTATAAKTWELPSLTHPRPKKGDADASPFSIQYG